MECDWQAAHTSDFDTMARVEHRGPHANHVHVGGHEPGALQIRAHVQLVLVHISVAGPSAQNARIHALRRPWAQVLVHQPLVRSSHAAAVPLQQHQAVSGACISARGRKHANEGMHAGDGQEWRRQTAQQCEEGTGTGQTCKGEKIVRQSASNCQQSSTQLMS